MAVKWLKTKLLGVRYREHKTRKHGIRLDRCFSIRYKVNGKDKEEVVGWSSGGVTADSASKILAVIRENIRQGKGPQSYVAIREANISQTEEDARINAQLAKENVTFAEFWKNEYLPIAEASKKKSSMDTEHGIYSNWLAPSLGKIPLQQIDVVKVEKIVLKAHKAKKSPATIRYILAVVSQVWGKAATQGLVQGECPVRKIKKPRQDNRRMRFLSPEEAQSLLNALAKRSSNMHDIALLSLFCGLRAGEIHALTWGDIDFKNESILIIDTKSKKNRHAFITQEVKDMLLRRHNNQTKNELVFPANNGKQKKWVSDTFMRVVDELGFNNTGEYSQDENGKPILVRILDTRQRVVFHTLRHTFASWLVQKGVPLYTVAELLGNTIEMAKRYSHLAPDSLRQAAMSLEGNLRSGHSQE